MFCTHPVTEMMFLTHHLSVCSDSSVRKKLRKEMRNSDSENEVMKKWKTRSRGGDESGMKYS